MSSTNARYDDWADLSAEEYEASKQDLIETTLDALEKYVPNCRERLDHVEAATPRTFQHYTQHPAGASFGTKFEGLAVSRGLPEQIGGLYHAGSVGIIMSGWLGAINYGVIVANDVDALLTRCSSDQSPGRLHACRRELIMSPISILDAIPHRGPILLVDEIVACSDDTHRLPQDVPATTSSSCRALPRLSRWCRACSCAKRHAGRRRAAGSRQRRSGPGVPVATRMNDVRFRRMVRPGETIDMEVELREQVSQALFPEGRSPLSTAKWPCGSSSPAPSRTSRIRTCRDRCCPE